MKVSKIALLAFSLLGCASLVTVTGCKKDGSAKTTKKSKKSKKAKKSKTSGKKKSEKKKAEDSSGWGF